MMMGGNPASMMKMMKSQKTGSTGICSTHFKERTLNALQDDGSGGLCCKDDQVCQVGKGGTDLRNEYCSTHKKRRTSVNLTEDGMGGFCCKPGMECQVSDKPKREPV